MSTAGRILSTAAAPSRLQVALSVLANEARALFGALLQPGKVLTEVDQMGKLLLAANALDERDPVRAKLLRRRASTIGLN
ncbi:MAG: hypothetical protein JSS56_16250 [Proteobacteria bacterium]|nr:hypothetical protein [Pseudomonadota bacterium]